MIEIALFHVKRTCKYKMQLFIEIINVILHFLVQYFLWMMILGQNYLFFEDANQMIIYYFFISILSVLLKCNAADIADAFKNGRMDRELIRPISLFEMKMAENVYSNLFLFMCTFPVLFILAFLCFQANFNVNVMNIITFVVSVVGAYIIYYCMDFIVGLMALLIDEIWAVRGIVGFCINMVAGYYLPIEMFPDTVISFIEYTPFYYIYYFPAKLIREVEMEFTLDIMMNWLMMFMWAILLFYLSKKVFSILIKKYTAFGG